MDKIDCVVIGAGVVGLSVARSLAMAGREVVVLEAENAIGTQTSARNSEVIHAGISYAPGSLKGRLCVAGKAALYAYCAERGIGHQRIGKLIVAVQEAELPELDKYVKLGAAHGVTDLRIIGAAEARDMEPEVACVGALHSPSTGIVDSHGLMLSYLGDAERAGASLALQSRVLAARPTADGIVLDVGGAEETSVLCNTVVNAAGLGAQQVASRIEGMPAEHVPPLYYAIGHYFSLARKSPFRHLVYPTGREGALRAHVTLDLGGQCKFGPDLSWRDGIDYSFDPSREAAFYQSVRRYFPGLRDGELQPGYTGIRPRLAGPGSSMHNTATDFVIQAPQVHGIAGLVNLFGIESPGLTASLALGAHVAQLVSNMQA
ncbi:NAD(P)/FAD-dependent oxidoreductase [Variovorax sp. J22G73]|jgi:L-2-hydroxyglutarate oxidase LhgO|uniref:NAD(P)/FAD-dependent oxidoreductase n=1 Tax=unclassified Variovorax TaxID=663243 RepID=UPI000D5EC978|nr:MULTISPECIES: NAD(P)/FAD-dependent oxidoreductase [unclassified Variovorax]MDM0003529.1 NAD(P)/FAD-dependent oxidoreductase [Variovorax sp. J22R203]MDM0096805.1 NAD(P)/FAD-dependent oxidoreductase [Variovorax sp. J22G73]